MSPSLSPLGFFTLVPMILLARLTCCIDSLDARTRSADSSLRSCLSSFCFSRSVCCFCWTSAAQEVPANVAHKIAIGNSPVTPIFAPLKNPACNLYRQDLVAIRRKNFNLCSLPHGSSSVLCVNYDCAMVNIIPRSGHGYLVLAT